jgi:predicted metal-dependent hydrolase
MVRKRWKNSVEFRQFIVEKSNEIGVVPKRIQIQSMTKKWASCSTTGRITFNKDLLNESRAFCNYVVVHELLHLQVPNHGKLFKALMLAFVPDYEKTMKKQISCGIV